jgi:hypothetical protein
MSVSTGDGALSVVEHVLYQYWILKILPKILNNSRQRESCATTVPVDPRPQSYHTDLTRIGAMSASDPSGMDVSRFRHFIYCYASRRLCNITGTAVTVQTVQYRYILVHVFLV